MKGKLRLFGFLSILTLTLSATWFGSGFAMSTAKDTAIEGEPLDNWFMIADESGDLSNAAVDFDSQHQEYLVIWQSNPPAETHIYAERVSTFGSLLGRYTVSAPGDLVRRNPDVAYNSQQDTFLVVWEQFDGNYYNIRGRIFHPNGPVGNEFWLGTGPELRNRYQPAVAYSSTSDKFLVVWESMVVGGLASDIQAQVVTGAGALEGSNFLIAQGNSSWSNDQPDLAYNRSRNEYLIAWVAEDRTVENQTDIFGKRVTRDGIILDVSPLLIGYHTPPETLPSVAAIPTIPDFGGYMVVWELHYTASDYDIYSRTITGTGGMNSVVIASSTSSNEMMPAVAGQENNDQYLIAFTRFFTPPFSNTDLFGKTASIDGVLTSSEKKIVAFSGKYPATIAGPNSDYLVVCENTQSDGTIDIVGRLWGFRTYTFLPMITK